MPHVTQVHNYLFVSLCCEWRRTKMRCLSIVLCPVQNGVTSPQGRRGPSDESLRAVQERIRHNRESCRRQLIVKLARGPERTNASLPSLALTAAPGEETSGAACFQRASLHYHSHSDGALQTTALNIHGKPTFITFHPSPARPNIMQIESLCSKF